MMFRASLLSESSSGYSEPPEGDQTPAVQVLAGVTQRLHVLERHLPGSRVEHQLHEPRYRGRMGVRVLHLPRKDEVLEEHQQPAGPGYPPHLREQRPFGLRGVVVHDGYAEDQVEAPFLVREDQIRAHNVETPRGEVGPRCKVLTGIYPHEAGLLRIETR